MVILYVIAILFLVLSVLLLSGHGACFLAGYNTSDAGKRAKYDEKKLCRVDGAGLLFLTILLFIMAFYKENLPDWFIAFFLIASIADVIVMLFLANTICCARNPEGSIQAVAETELSATDMRRNKQLAKGSILFTILTFVMVGILLVTGEIHFQCRENELVIEASYYPDMVIAYDKIQSVKLYGGSLKGARAGGFGSLRLLMGGFENKEFGSYTRYTYTDCEEYIALKLKDRKNPVVIAAKNKEKTEEIYEELVERCGNVN